MCPTYDKLNEHLTNQIKEDFYNKIYQHKESPLQEAIRTMHSERDSFSFKTKETVTLEEINEKLDKLLMQDDQSSSYIFTGKDVIAEFKRLNGGK